MTQSSARGVYGIAVTAELTGVPEQTLRLYEKKGLLTPSRTEGGTRRYSDDDVTHVRRILTLLLDGVGLAGARRILELEDANAALQRRIDKLTGR